MCCILFVPWLRKTSDGRAPGRERLNHTLSRCRRAGKCAFGQLTTRWSFLQNLFCSEVWIILAISQRLAVPRKPCARRKNGIL